MQNVILEITIQKNKYYKKERKIKKYILLKKLNNGFFLKNIF